MHRFFFFGLLLIYRNQIYKITCFILFTSFGWVHNLSPSNTINQQNQ